MLRHRGVARIVLMISIAALAIGAFLLFPLLGSGDLGGGRVWAGFVSVIVGIVVLIGGWSGAGAELGLRRDGVMAVAEVVEVTPEKTMRKGQSELVHIARVRYRDQVGTAYEEVIEATPEEASRLRPGTHINVKYNRERPSAFLWIDDEER